MTHGTRRRTVGIALGATVLVHAGIAWWLLGLQQTLPVRETATLEVTWIDRPAPVIPPRPQTPASAPPASELSPPVQVRSQRSALQAADLETPSIEVDAPLPNAGALLEQAGEWARQQAPDADFSHDPLRHRTPPAPDGRFAMRRSVTAADVARGIGQLFGGAAYTQDPCPQIRRNVANLGNGGDAELAAEEIRRLRQFCL